MVSYSIIRVQLRSDKLSFAFALAGLKQLQGLSLIYTRVTDGGLKHLAGLKRLQDLYLIGTQVTDAGLKHLAGLKQLRELDLFQTLVTAEGKAELKKALPDLEINK